MDEINSTWKVRCDRFTPNDASKTLLKTFNFEIYNFTLGHLKRANLNQSLILNLGLVACEWSI